MLKQKSFIFLEIKYTCAVVSKRKDLFWGNIFMQGIPIIYLVGSLHSLPQTFNFWKRNRREFIVYNIKKCLRNITLNVLIGFLCFPSSSILYLLLLVQSCKLGRNFRVRFEPCSGLTLRKTSGLFRAGYDAC